MGIAIHNEIGVTGIFTPKDVRIAVVFPIVFPAVIGSNLLCFLIPDAASRQFERGSSNVRMSNLLFERGQDQVNTNKNEQQVRHFIHCQINSLSIDVN